MPKGWEDNTYIPQKCCLLHVTILIFLGGGGGFNTEAPHWFFFKFTELNLTRVELMKALMLFEFFHVSHTYIPPNSHI